MVLNYINMLPLSETEVTAEDTAVIYFKILSWNHKDNEKIKTVNTHTNRNMEVL